MGNLEAFNGTNEQMPRKVIDIVGADVRNALTDRDEDALLEAVSGDVHNEALLVIGLRVQLREFWRARKDGLASIGGDDATRIETDIKNLFASMDADLLAITGIEPDDYAIRWNESLVAELERLSADKRLALMDRFVAISSESLDAPDNLLPWVADWRDVLVDDLWAPVRTMREEGMSEAAKSELADALQTTNGHIDKLIFGALHPEATDE